MFGNLMNNIQLRELVSSGHKIIDPFSKDLQKVAHYPLTPEVIYVPETARPENGPRKLSIHHSFKIDANPCFIKPNQYVIVEVAEMVKMPAGIVGQFTPASNLVDQGFGLTAGRVDHPFGASNQKLMFGLKNYFDEPNELRKSDLIAYVYFFDLRGLLSDTVDLTDRDMSILAMRTMEEIKNRLERAKSDGVDYGDGS